MAQPSDKERKNNLVIALLCSTAILSHLLIQTGTAQAQIAARVQTYEFNIPVKSVAASVAEIGAKTGWRIGYAFSLPSSVKTNGLAGTMTAEQAVAHILIGTDIRYRVTGARSIVLEKLGAVPDTTIASAGTIQLNTITIGAGINPADTPFTTSGSGTYLSAEQIQNVKGTSPGDLFSGIAGVINGESRNSGSVDLNIRGLQGQGRAPVVVDGARQETTVYRGYNGAQSRSYIDPDFIGSVNIEKGTSVGMDANGAIGGIVRMNTIGADDILLPEKNIGVRLKGGFNTNNSSVPALETPGGMRINNNLSPADYSSQEGMDRPSFLTPTGGSGSIAAAAKFNQLEITGAYARRKNGNYHAGKHGDDAAHAIFTPKKNGYNISYGGLNQYRAGEAILNTSQDNESWLIKGKYTSDNGHKLELGYTKYSSTYGEIMPTQIWNTFTSGPYQGYLNDVELDTYTANYHWNPDDNDFIDLKINAYYTNLQLEINSAMKTETQITPVLWYSANKRKGISAENTSRFETAFGDLSLNYGLGFVHENLGYPDGYTYKPSDNMNLGPAREGHRNEWNAVASAEWKPTNWLTFSPAIRYSRYDSTDRNPILDTLWGEYYVHYGETIKSSDGGWSPMATLTVEPVEGWRIFAKASSTLRSPSSFEALKGVSFIDFGNEVTVVPERNNSFELGTSYLTEGIILSDDKLRFHAAYFNNNVKNFLTRVGKPKELFSGYYYEALTLVNLDYAKMSGLEMTADYDTGQYFGGISWNHYLDTMYCAKEGTLMPKRSLCAEGGLFNSYTLQQVPPKDTVTVHLGARFIEDKLTIGGRVMYTGKRMVKGIGDGSEDAYMGSQLQASKWNPYTIVDLYMNYKHSESLEFNAGIDNLTDRYYMDALNASLMPAPGRTFRFNMSAKF